MIDPHSVDDAYLLEALSRGKWPQSARRWKEEKKPTRERALRALARARRILARSRRRRDEALRGLSRLESELRAARAARPQEAPPRSSAEEAAERARAHELEKELAAAQEAVANLVQRVATERRRWKAAMLSDRRRLLSGLSAAESADARRRKAIEAELASEQEAVANLMEGIMRERRRWKASLLFVRRHLLKAMRSRSSEAVRRLTAVESELKQSQEACANLMVELSAQKRSGKARLVALERRALKDRRGGAAGQKKAPEAPSPAPARPAAASPSALGESLRRLAESPSEETREPPPVAEASRTRAREVILAALASKPPRPSSGDLRAAVMRRLTVWESAFRARRFTIVPPDGPGWPTVLFESSVLQTMLDELLAVLLARMPRAGTLVVKGGKSEAGSFVEFLCGGAAPSPEARAGEAGVPMVRALAEAWGGGLDIDAGPRGRGTRIRLRLASD